MGRTEIASFIGGLRKAKGIYVSTGGFTNEAKFEAERAEAYPIEKDLLVSRLALYFLTFIRLCS